VLKVSRMKARMRSTEVSEPLDAIEVFFCRFRITNGWFSMFLSFVTNDVRVCVFLYSYVLDNTKCFARKIFLLKL